MRTKLTNIKGIEKMSQEKILEQVEAMFLSSNPKYMRRIQEWRTASSREKRSVTTSTG